MRTDLELQGLVAALKTSRGVAPPWLQARLDARKTPGLDFGPRELRSLAGLSLSTAALLAAFIVSATFDVSPRTSLPPRAPRQSVAMDVDAADAVAMVQEWKIAGDETPVLERLGESVARAAGPRAWTAERTGPDAFLVVFRERGGPAYAFEVDLAAEEVHATPETVDLLTLRRVRDESAAARGLLAAR